MSDKKKKKVSNRVSYNSGLYSYSKNKSEKPTRLYSTTPIILAKNASRQLSQQKRIQRGQKSYHCKIRVSYGYTPIQKTKSEKPTRLYSTTPIILAKNCGLYSHSKNRSEKPTRLYFTTPIRDPCKKRVLSIIIVEKDPKRAEKLSLQNTCKL